MVAQTYPHLIECGNRVMIVPSDHLPEYLKDYAGMEGRVTMMIYYDPEMCYVEEDDDGHGRKIHVRANHVVKLDTVLPAELPCVS